MISIDKAYQLIDLAAVGIKLATERVNVQEGLNRVVADEQLSKLDLPSFNKSAMDGYAVLAGDEQEEYQILEVVPAGRVPSKKLQKGTVIKVMTGAPVPDGAGRVVPVEKTEEKGGGKVRILSFDKGSHICAKGEDVRCGDLVVKSSETLSPLGIANLISCGITELNVYQKPRIFIISTGDELVDSVAEIVPGKIMNSNGPMLNMLCKQYGYDVVGYDVVSDDVNSTAKVLKKALTMADIIIFSGGVSMGEFDYVAEVMNDVGLKTHFDRIAVKPGKPTTFASKNNKFVFGLPGNPVAVYLTFRLFVRRLIKLITAEKPEENYILLELAKDFKRKKAERAEFVPGELLSEGLIEAVEFHGSAHLLALLQADGFFVVPAGVEKISKGERVKFLVL